MNTSEKTLYSKAIKKSKNLRAKYFSSVTENQNMDKTTRALGENMVLLIAEMLIRDYQPNMYSSAHKDFLYGQRIVVGELLIKNPGYDLFTHTFLDLSKVYDVAVAIARYELGSPESFSPPLTCPYSISKMVNFVPLSERFRVARPSA